jgi:endonuclease/exonuclease/phosphatase family metal-dependent hydrolase
MNKLKKYFKIIKISLVGLLILGVLSSYINFGFLSIFFSVFLPFLFLLNILILIEGIRNKKYFYAIGIVFVLICFNFSFRITKKKTKQVEDSISMLSYNVREFNADNDINKKDISNKILEFINSKNADILCLQESSKHDSEKINNYPYKFSGSKKNKTLLAIYSKYPIIKTGFIDFPNTINNAIFADIKIQKDTIRLYNLHLQSFGIELNSAKEKNNQYAAFIKKINKGLTKQIEQAKLVKTNSINCNKKIIISGDFNSTPFSLPYRILEERLNDTYICEGYGLGNTFNLFNYPLRLDYFLIDSSIKIYSHENFYLNLSDHEPIFIKFKLTSNILNN